MPESVGSRAAEFGPQRQTEQASAENGVISEKRCLDQHSGTTLQGAASLTDRIAIVVRKGYRDHVDFLRFIPGLSSSWRSNTSKKNPHRMLRLRVCVGLKKRTVCPGKMVTVRALIVNEEPCTLETCIYRADYTTAAVSLFQKEPVKPNETRANSERKSRKPKR